MDAGDLFESFVLVSVLIILLTGFATQLFGIYKKNKYIETGEYIEPPKILVWLTTGINFCLTNGPKICIALVIILFVLSSVRNVIIGPPEVHGDISKVHIENHIHHQKEIREMLHPNN